MEMDIVIRTADPALDASRYYDELDAQDRAHERRKRELTQELMDSFSIGRYAPFVLDCMGEWMAGAGENCNLPALLLCRLLDQGEPIESIRAEWEALKTRYVQAAAAEKFGD